MIFNLPGGGFLIGSALSAADCKYAIEPSATLRHIELRRVASIFGFIASLGLSRILTIYEIRDAFCDRAGTFRRHARGRQTAHGTRRHVPHQTCLGST